MEPSKKRKNVYISTSQRDRERQGTRRAVSGQGPATRTPTVVDPKKTVAARRAEDRRTERETRLADQRFRLRLRVAIVVAVVVAVMASCTGVWRSSLFAVRRIEIAGASTVTAARVRSLAKVPADATLLRFPAEEVAARVEEDPYVESATVSRVFPDGMRIRIVERTAAVIVETEKGRWIVDRHGYVMSLVPTSTPSALTSAPAVPTIKDVPGLDPKPGRRTGSEVLVNALDVLAGVSTQLAGLVASVSAPTIDGTTLLTRDRIEIVIGEATELVVKDKLARAILSEQRGKVVSIDVRVIDRPTWRGLK